MDVPRPFEQLSNVKIETISCGREFAVALSTCNLKHFLKVIANKVFSWGKNLFGSLGASREEKLFVTPFEVEVPPIVDIAAGEFHVLALTNKNQLYGWGKSTEGYDY